MLSRLQGFCHGQVTLVDGPESVTTGARTAECDCQATITVHHPRFYFDLVLGGDVAAGEGYVRGDWSCDDLTSLVRIICRNNPVSQRLHGGWVRATNLLRQLMHRLHRNTRSGSRTNIAAHYDLGNDLFQLFLDETLMYSCGIFERADSTLREASVAKNDLICRKLQLSPQDHLLEIGSGWGGFAMHAAREYGCRVTTTTISQQQFDLAQERIAAAGLSDRITLLLTDYRDLTGSYDKLVSIEMLEAVGSKYWDVYFQQCARLLKPQGRMLLQTITIADQEFANYQQNIDFIQKYIFPGGCLPSLTEICRSLTQASDLQAVHVEEIGPHYARTLRCWRDRFFAQIDRVRELGYPETFIRLWDYYLCYCEGAFRERSVGNVQMLLAKPLCRLDPLY